MRIAKVGKPIKFYYLSPANFPHKALVRKTILRIFKKENKDIKALNFIFCSDAYLLKINRMYLGHNHYTDIITFDFSSVQNEIIADVYISSDRIKENAYELAIPRAEEYLRVIIHGALHLCGYKDKTREDKRRMRKAEDYYLKRHSKIVSRKTVSRRNKR